MQFKKLLCLTLLSLTLSGCATVINGPTQKIPVNSSPQGAKVTVDGVNSYITPAEIPMERKRDHSLTFSKEGYDDALFVMKHVVSGAVAGNIIAGGLIGWGVDAATGAQFKLVPETVYVTLAPTGSEEARNRIGIQSVLDELDAMLAAKTITKLQYDKAKLAAIKEQGQAHPRTALVLLKEAAGYDPDKPIKSAAAGGTVVSTK